MIFPLPIPFASGSTALNLYRAMRIPEPTNDFDGYASQYKTETDFLQLLKQRKELRYCHSIK